MESAGLSLAIASLLDYSRPEAETAGASRLLKVNPRSLDMVARMDGELFPQGLFTPQPELSDSDDVLLSLETARALEMQGEIREAVRWLRRAADDAEKDGNDERVLALARAAADLSNTLAPLQSQAAPAASQADVPTMPPPYPPTTPPPDSFEATIPPPASASAATTSDEPALTPSNPPITERSMRIGAIRVALAEGSVRGVKSFYVERLEKGQPAPAGTMEAMLVFSGETDESNELESTPRAAGDSTTS